MVAVGCSKETAVLPTAVPETAVVVPTATAEIATIPPEPTNISTPEPTPFPPDLSLTAQDIFAFPNPEIYAGDLVTFQVMPFVSQTVVADDVSVHVMVDGYDVAAGTLNERNFSGDPRSVFAWAWDSSNHIGSHEVRVVLDRDDKIVVGDEDPTNNQAAITLMVLDPKDIPATEENATWVTADTSCCVIHTVSGTAAYRDLPNLVKVVDDAAAQAATRLNEQPQRKIDIYLIDRVIGQGGYAGSAIVASYLDRQYSGNSVHELLVHEITHIIDQQFAPHRLVFLAEGVAVWATGGHYKVEDLTERNAALLALGQNVPLTEMINNFYPVQHEIGYLQAGGFIEYLIDTYGWSTFRAFYSNTTLDDGATPAEAVDRNLQTYYNKSLAQMEAEWQDALRVLELGETAVLDLQTTIRFFDTMRHYQLLYDPTAHFLRAWIPQPKAVRTQGNPADLTRHPTAELNVTLEVMLEAANTAWRNGDYQRANVILDSVERVLDNNGTFIDPLATNYLNIVRKVTAVGYKVQSVTLQGDEAQLVVTLANKNGLLPINMRLVNRDWIILAN
ncbi:MAG: hypothetical protein R3C62_21400 [Chloroflexota bacterium]